MDGRTEKATERTENHSEIIGASRTPRIIAEIYNYSAMRK
jgi:hypothetical protein